MAQERVPYIKRLLLPGVSLLLLYVSSFQVEHKPLHVRQTFTNGSFFWRYIFNQFKQSIYLSKCNKHWTGHQGRMQLPLTGAHKNSVSKSNKVTTIPGREKNLVNRKMFKSNISWLWNTCSPTTDSQWFPQNLHVNDYRRLVEPEPEKTRQMVNGGRR